MKPDIGRLALSIALAVLLIGCSHTLHQRERNEVDPADQGSETSFTLKGPKAAIEHRF